MCLLRCELSIDDRDSFFSIRDGLCCQSRQDKAWGGARATLGAFAGKVYYEVGVSWMLLRSWLLYGKALWNRNTQCPI